MATFKGAAYTVEDTATGDRFFSVAFKTRTDPTNVADHDSFETTASLSESTFVYGTDVQGAAPPGAPNEVIITLLDADSATIISEETLTGPVDGDFVTLPITSNGSAIIGDIRLKIQAVRTDLGTYDVNSDDQDTRGFFRSNPTAFSFIDQTRNQGVLVPSGAIRSWPDIQDVELSTSHKPLTERGVRDYIVKSLSSDLSQTFKSGETVAATGTTQSLTSTFKVNLDYPEAQTTVLFEATVNSSSIAPDSDTGLGWFKIPSSSVNFVDGRTARTETFEVDPRINFRTAKRTSPEAIVNYSRGAVIYQRVSGTFKLENARGDLFTSNSASSDVDVLLFVQDVLSGTDEKQITGMRSPNVSGLYTVPSFVFTGSTLKTSRNIGTDGSTAFNNATGKDKTLKVQLSPSGNIAPNTAWTGSFVSLSSLLQLDVHPQKTKQLIKDTDPFVEPGDGESTSYIISADSLFVWAFVADVNKKPRGGVKATFARFDLTGSKVSATPDKEGTTRNTGADKGWTNQPSQLNVSAPAGVFKVRTVVDVDHVGAVGNYGEGETAPNNPAAKDQEINFISAFTEDRAAAIIVPPLLALSESVDILGSYKDITGNSFALPTNPEIRIISVNKDGTENVVQPKTSMTKIGISNEFKFTWIPNTTGSFSIEFIAELNEAGILATEKVHVIRRYDPIALALHDVLVSRLDPLT